MSIRFKEQKPALLERFGVYYLDLSFQSVRAGLSNPVRSLRAE